MKWRKTICWFLALILILTACGAASAPQERGTESAGLQSLALEPGERTAQVGLTADGPGALLVAVYDTEGRMVSLGGRRVTAGETSVSVQLLGADTPQQFRAKAYLLAADATPLCASYLLDHTAPEPETPGNKTLVACFSYTGHTKAVAGEIAEAVGGDLFEIIPAEPYPEDTNNYYDPSTRAYQEQQDPAARPALAPGHGVENWEDYDVVFLGYPIWYGAPPKIVYTFLEQYDFAGKTVVAFSTSASSGHSDSALRPLAPEATWLPGHRFDIGADQAAVNAWLDTLELPTQEETAMNKLTLSFNGHTYPATLEDTPAAKEFAQLLQSKGGAMTLHLDEYGGWEKVGPLGQALTNRQDAQTTTQAGDFVLYSGDQIVLFYGSNSWSYTRLGRLDDPSGLADALGRGEVDVTFQLTGAR